MIVLVFVAGYLAIVLEQPLRLHKTSSALLTGVLCWTVLALRHGASVAPRVEAQLGDIASVLFFLLGAMAIVELIDAHDGFDLVTARITVSGRRRLLGVVAAVTFLLSAVLDNLTTAIVMMTVVRKLLRDDDDRRLFGGVVVLAANAGGVWSPIGDVTTTMLWTGGEVSALGVVRRLFVPSLVSLAVPVLWIARRLHGDRGALSMPGDEATVAAPDDASSPHVAAKNTTPRERATVLVVGVAGLVVVPVFRALTHLPPVLGVLLALGALGAVTDLLHKHEDPDRRSALSIAGALQRIDAPSVLFFLGILLAVGALASDGALARLARFLDAHIGSPDVVTLCIGLASAVVDNVPLVAAARGMYGHAQFPMDHRFWVFLAYCAGTGGSILVIGSAAGVAVMGLQRITFGWYLRNLSLPALAGYLAGALTFLGTEWLRG